MPEPTRIRFSNRVAAIDAGSNTILLLIVEKTGDTRLHVLHDEQVFARLGEGVDTTGALSDAAFKRGLEAFAHFHEITQHHQVDHIVAVGTSALRDASNGLDFCAEVKARTGIEIEIASGEREAQLSYSAVSHSIAVTGTLLVVDIGGNSTELIRGNADAIVNAKSLNVGAVRMTERFLPSDPPTDAERAALDSFLVATLAELAADPEPETVVAVAGTATTLAALHLELDAYDSSRIHGTELSTRDLDTLTAKLSALTSKQRAEIPCLHPKRADVIVAGAQILRAALRRFRRDTCTVIDRGIRHAAAFDALRIASGTPVELG